VDPLERGLRTALRPGPLRDALRGTWLGHPLHPPLTDVPIGFWTSAVVLDVLGGRSAERSADLLIGLGLASSVPVAAAGLADWSEASRRAQRQGVVHALANTAAQALFAASLLARRSDRRTGRWLALLGTASLAAGSYIGGHLAYVEGAGVSSPPGAPNAAG
jgi:uncharacterized membrane protein